MTRSSGRDRVWPAVLVLAMAIGCGDQGGGGDVAKPETAGGSAPSSSEPILPSQEQLERIAFDQPYAEAESILGGPGRPIGIAELPFDPPPPGDDARVMMERLDYYVWGPGTRENFLVLGVTKEEPRVVKYTSMRRTRRI